MAKKKDINDATTLRKAIAEKALLESQLEPSEEKVQQQDKFLAQQITNAYSEPANHFGYHSTVNYLNGIDDKGQEHIEAIRSNNDGGTVTDIVKTIKRHRNQLTLIAPPEAKEEIAQLEEIGAARGTTKGGFVSFRIDFNDDEQLRKFSELLFSRQAANIAGKAIGRAEEEYRDARAKMEELRNQFSRVLDVKAHAPLVEAQEELRTGMQKIGAEKSQAR